MKLKMNFDGFEAKLGDAENAQKSLLDTNGKYKGYIGWLDVKRFLSDANEIESIAKEIQSNSDVLIVIGTGGSSQGARFVVNLLNGRYQTKNKVQIMFLGEHLNSDEIEDAKEIIKNKRVTLNFISKSGTTLEPSIAFDILYEAMKEEYNGEELKSRIIFTTDKEKGIARETATKEGFRTFIVPDDIGGRYSVLTPVGLLPIAVSGIDINELLDGAMIGVQKHTKTKSDCHKYAAARVALAEKYCVDIFTFFNPNAEDFGTWLCQLFGESEGKNGIGIYPTVNIYPKDLHSVGQFVQDGRKCLFETITHFKLSSDQSKLNELNNKMYDAVIKAHTDGGVPLIEIICDELNATTVGELIIFFENACALCCEIQSVNPFNQPGVEAYKSVLRKLLGDFVL